MAHVSVPFAGPLVFALNGEKVEIAPEELDMSWTLNDYVRNRAKLRGTVSPGRGLSSPVDGHYDPVTPTRDWRVV
jgi:hypothetical protein